MWIHQYAHLIEGFLHANFILAPLLLITVEEMGIPILVPGDAILAYTGALVKGAGPSVSMITATVIGILAVLIGSTILYFIAHRWGQLIVRKLGQFIFLKESQIDKAEALFAKYGVLTIILGRHIPGMRVPVTIFAATSGVKYSTFILSTFISAILWIFFWLSFGHHYGANIEHLVRAHTLPSFLILVGIILAFVLFHFIGKLREKRHKIKVATLKKE